MATSVSGWVLLGVGVVLFPLPGPGLLVMAGGLVLLARVHPWAERRVVQVRRRAWEQAERGVATPWRAVWSITVTTALAASGLVWLWAPQEPAWWVLPAWTWLPGGTWAGLGQIGSGLLTLGLVLAALWCRRARPLTEPSHGSGIMRP